VEIHVPDRGAVTLQTVSSGDILGWSWVFPPYRWNSDARATELTRAIALDGACLRRKCEETPSLGYELMKRFARVLDESLQASRLQLLDVYGHRTR
jgi:CRP-like cAMP-binding protein